MNERKMGILIGYINIILQTLTNIVYVPILIYYIGNSEYGLYQLIGSFIAYFSIMDFGLTTSVIRFYTKYKSLNDKINMENILAISLRGYCLITIILFVVGLIIYSQIEYIFYYSMSIDEICSAKNLFILLLINLIVSMIGMLFRAIITSYEKFIFLKIIDMIQLLIQPILIVFILQKYPFAFYIALVQTIFNIILNVSRYIYCLRKLNIKIKYHYWDKFLFRELRDLSLSVFFVALIEQIFFKTNQIILGVISGTTAVAIYAIASLIYVSYQALSLAISGVYLPYITELIIIRKADVDILSNIFIKIGRYQFFLLSIILSGFIIFGNQFINIWAGMGFNDAYWIALLIIIPFTIELIQNTGLNILQAQNRYAFRAKIYFCIGIFNICISIPLGLRYGGIGCAFATSLSMFIGNGLIMNYYYLKVTKLDIKSFWQQIGKITLGIIPITLIGYLININLMNDSILFFAFKILIYVIVYSILMYKLFMNFDEQNKIKSIIYKITRQKI